jgi:ABC-type multidrug transport system fused ATPase/permease subunit
VSGSAHIVHSHDHGEHGPAGPGRLGGAAGHLRALLWVLRPHRRLLVAAIAAGLVNQLAFGAAAVTGAVVVGLAAHGASAEELLPGVALVAILVMPRSIAPWLDSVLSHALAFRALVDVRDRIYEAFERLAPGDLADRRSGDLGATVIGDVERLERFFAHTLGPLVVAVGVPAVGVAALAVVHPLTAVATVPFIFLIGSVPIWLARRAEHQAEQYRAALGGLHAHAVDSIQGLREILTFGAGERRLAELDEQERAIRQIRVGHVLRAGLEKAAIDGLVIAGTVTALAVGGGLVAGGELSPVLLPAVVVLAAMTLSPVAAVADVGRELAIVAAGAQRMTALLRQPARVVEPLPARGRSSDGEPRGTVSFHAVTFRYRPELPEALHAVTFRVEAGETLAIVGHSGAGKSTIVNLLLRFWDPDSGRIKVGGSDLRSLDRETRARLVGVVPQDIYLFHDTVRSNIALGQPDASDADVESAARAALAHEFIVNELPDGYRTVVGERGARLSGGQRQRIGIARALLLDAPVLALDEPVSHLDTESERLLAQAMARVRLGRTTLLIAHRLSTMELADRILVLERGLAVEEGPFDVLLARDGAFARLVRQQRAGSVPVDDDEGGD